jgi:hypothetical protein
MCTVVLSLLITAEVQGVVDLIKEKKLCTCTCDRSIRNGSSNQVDVSAEYNTQILWHCPAERYLFVNKQYI